MKQMKLVLASILSCVGPLTTEVFAPAMRFVKRELSMQSIEESVSIFLAISAIFHILHGYFITKINFSCVCICALTLYTLGSFAIACAAPVPFLLLRLIQGLGASGCTVCGFACIRMYLRPKDHIPIVNFARSIVLILAPMISEFVVHADMYHWRSSFFILAVTGLVGMMFTVCVLHQQPAYTLTSANQNNTYRFAIWCLIDACGFSAMFIWIAYAPFLRNTANFGYFYGLTFVGSAVGSLLAKYFNPKPAVITGNLIVILMSILCMFYVEEDAIFIFMTCSNCARALSGAHAQSQSLKYASSAGKLAGIFHFVRMALTSLCVFACSFIDDKMTNHHIPWVLMVGLCSLAIGLLTFAQIK